MFACLAAGRSVQTDAVAVSATECFFVLPEAHKLNHIAVFLTTPAPFDTAAVVHCATEVDIASNTPWRRLGFLSNEKPSAIFRVSGAAPDAGAMRLGISLEPLANAMAFLPPTGSGDARRTDASGATRIAESLFHYATSFAKPAAAFMPGESVVPVAVVEKWLANAAHKLQQGLEP